jgi:NADH-quinone oxidoreductase subunit M
MNLLLPALILVPLLTGLLLLGLRGSASAAVSLSRLGAALTLLLSIALVSSVYPASPVDNGAAGSIQMQLHYPLSWMKLSLPLNVGGHPVAWEFSLGADGISAMLVLLTGIVGFFTVWLAGNQIKTALASYTALLLLTIAMLMGVFLAQELVSFYIFFEAVLIPLMFLISGWGNGGKPQLAARRFLLYTLVGSIPMVLGLLLVAIGPLSQGLPPSISLVELSKAAARASAEGGPASIRETCALWLLILGLGIKTAILPLHTWLPLTYSSAHPNTTSLLASVVAKLGLYGMLRLVIPLLPTALATEAQLVLGTLGVAAIVYGALIALSKDDLREVLAFGSLSHVGFITMGLMSLTQEGLAGATIQMFNHGIITAAMFWILSMLEERLGPLSLREDNRGLAVRYPRLAVMLIFFILAGAGLPGLNGFVGELLAMSGMMRVSGLLVAFAVLGTIFGAWYGLRLVQRLLFGSDGSKHGTSSHPMAERDLNGSESLGLVAVALLCVAIGCYPNGALRLFLSDTDRLAIAVEPVSKSVHPQMDVLVSPTPVP